MMQNRTLFFGDNLEILREKIPDETFDLIYLDPPFNSKRDYNILFKEGLQENQAQIKAFEDSWHWTRKAESIFEELIGAKSSEAKTNQKISDFSKSKYTKQDKGGWYKEIRHKDGKIYKQYQKEEMRLRDVWDIPIINAMAKERLGYPTQKDRFQFEYWALDLVEAMPAQSKTKEKMHGADKGIDGIITIVMDIKNGKKEFSKIQIMTVKELLVGKKPDMPYWTEPYHKEAKKVEEDARNKQSALGI